MGNRDALIVGGIVSGVAALVVAAFIAGVGVGKAQASPVSRPIPMPLDVARIAPRQAASAATRPTSAQPDIIQTTPEDVLAAFKSNSVAARDWLSDKTVRMTYEVAAVSNNAFGGDRVAVVFQPSDQSILPPHVEFWFQGDFRSEIGKLQVGQKVTCEGAFKDEHIGGDIEFSGTNIVAN